MNYHPRGDIDLYGQLYPNVAELNRALDQFLDSKDIRPWLRYGGRGLWRKVRHHYVMYPSDDRDPNNPTWMDQQIDDVLYSSNPTYVQPSYETEDGHSQL